MNNLSRRNFVLLGGASVAANLFSVKSGALFKPYKNAFASPQLLVWGGWDNNGNSFSQIPQFEIGLNASMKAVSTGSLLRWFGQLATSLTGDVLADSVNEWKNRLTRQNDRQSVTNVNVMMENHDFRDYSQDTVYLTYPMAFYALGNTDTLNICAPFYKMSTTKGDKIEKVPSMDDPDSGALMRVRQR